MTNVKENMNTLKIRESERKIRRKAISKQKEKVKSGVRMSNFPFIWLSAKSGKSVFFLHWRGELTVK